MFSSWFCLSCASFIACWSTRTRIHDRDSVNVLCNYLSKSLASIMKIKYAIVVIKIKAAIVIITF